MGFSKQGKKPGWRTSSNCVQNAFFRLSPSGRNEKTTLGSNTTRSVSYHHFEWAFPSRAKSRVDERRPIAFKTRFFDIPHQGETKQHPWDRIPRGRFHTTILSGLFQAGQKAGLTNVVQLRSKRVFSTFPFGRNEKTPLGSNTTRSVSYHHFEWAFPSRAKSRVDERRPIAFKTRFFDFPHRGETKQHPWDRIPRGRFHTTILSGLFQAGQKAGLTNVVQLRSKRVFSTFPIGAKRKNTLRIEYHEVGFIPPFWVGFSKQGKKPGWRTSSNCVQNAFFRLSPSGRNEKTTLGSNTTRSVSYHHFEWAFPSRAKSRVDERRPIAFKTRFFDIPHQGETKQHPWNRIPRGRFHTTILSGPFQAGQKAGLTNVVQLRSKRVFSTFPIGAKRKNTLRIEYHEVGFIPPFWVGFSKQGKKPGWRTSSNCVQNAFFRLSPSGRNEKTTLGSNTTRSVSYHHFEWAFPSRAKSRVDERRPIAFKTRFFDIPHQGETKQHPWNRIPRVEFDSKGVASFRPDGECRKNAFWTQLDDVRQPGFLPCLEKPTQNGGMKPTSWYSILRLFFRFAPMGKVEKTHFERNWTTFVNPAFCPAWKSPLKMVVWNRPRGIRSQGCCFVSPWWGMSKKRVLNAIGRRSSTRLFALLGKAHSKWWYETDLVVFDPKVVFSFRPDGESRKNAFWTQLDDVRQPGFLPCLEKPTQNGGMKPT